MCVQEVLPTVISILEEKRGKTIPASADPSTPSQIVIIRLHLAATRWLATSFLCGQEKGVGTVYALAALHIAEGRASLQTASIEHPNISNRRNAYRSRCCRDVGDDDPSLASLVAIDDERSVICGALGHRATG